MHADAEQARLVKETPAFSPNKSFKTELAMQEKKLTSDYFSAVREMRRHLNSICRLLTEESSDPISKNSRALSAQILPEENIQNRTLSEEIN